LGMVLDIYRVGYHQYNAFIYYSVSRANEKEGVKSDYILIRRR